MKLILFLVLFMSLSSPVTASTWREMNTAVERSGCDWVLHSAIGAGIGYGIASQYQLSGWKAYAAGVGTAFALGLMKEATDKHFNLQDAAEWGAGAVIGVTLVW